MIFSQRGFTLIEAMLAIVALAFGMLGVIGMHLNATRSQLLTIELAEARNLSMNYLDQLRADDFALMSDGNECCKTTDATDDGDALACGTSVCSDGNALYRLEWSISNNTPRQGTHEIHLEVGWPASEGNCKTSVDQCLQTQEYTTYVTDI